MKKWSIGDAIGKMVATIFTLMLVSVLYWVFVDTRPPLSNYDDWGVFRAPAILGGTRTNVVTPYGNVSGTDKPVLIKVYAGQEFYVWRHHCFSTETPVTISREFVDGVIYYTPSQFRIYQSGCYNLPLEVQVPPTLVPGYYDYRVDLSMKTNPIISTIVALPIIHLYVMPNPTPLVQSPDSEGEN